MGKVVKIAMKKGCIESNNPLDIQGIYIEEDNQVQLYSPEELYDILIIGKKEIFIPIPPYPRLVPVFSMKQQKYVRAAMKKGLPNGLMKVQRVESIK